MTSHDELLARIIDDDALSHADRLSELRTIRSQAADLLRASGPTEAEDLREDVRKIDAMIASLLAGGDQPQAGTL